MLRQHRRVVARPPRPLAIANVVLAATIKTLADEAAAETHAAAYVEESETDSNKNLTANENR